MRTRVFHLNILFGNSLSVKIMGTNLIMFGWVQNDTNLRLLGKKILINLISHCGKKILNSFNLKVTQKRSQLDDRTFIVLVENL